MDAVTTVKTAVRLLWVIGIAWMLGINSVQAAGPVRRDVIFCNGFDHTISTSIGYYTQPYSQTEVTPITVRGWFVLKPNECKTVYNGPIYHTLWSYAESIGQKDVWVGRLDDPCAKLQGLPFRACLEEESSRDGYSQGYCVQDKAFELDVHSVCERELTADEEECTKRYIMAGRNMEECRADGTRTAFFSQFNPNKTSSIASKTIASGNFYYYNNASRKTVSVNSINNIRCILLFIGVK